MKNLAIKTLKKNNLLNTDARKMTVFYKNADDFFNMLSRLHGREIHKKYGPSHKLIHLKL